MATVIPELPTALLRRKLTAKALTEAGYPVSEKTLATKAVRGNLSRRTLRKEMKDWSAVNMPDLDERTVERWIDDLVDVTLLAPD